MALDDAKLTELAMSHDPFPLLQQLGGGMQVSPQAQAGFGGSFANMIAPGETGGVPSAAKGLPTGMNPAMMGQMMGGLMTPPAQPHFMSAVAPRAAGHVQVSAPVAAPQASRASIPSLAAILSGRG